MKFIDLDIQSNLSTGKSSVEEIAKLAEKLGFSGIAICDVWQGHERLKQLKEKIAEVQKLVKIEIIIGAKIEAKTVPELKRALEQVRESVVVVCVAGGSYEINRAACEDSRVDFLAHPALGRRDNGLDEVCLNAASKNNIAIELNFREVLLNYRKGRAIVLSNLSTNVRLCQQLGVKMVASSGANSVLEMRDPRELVSLANVIGMELQDSFTTVSDIPNAIVESNRKKLEGKTIAPGIEIIDKGEKSV